MKKSLFILVLALLGSLGAKGALNADWKIYMPFDAWAFSVVETPQRVYFLNRTFENNPSLPDRSIPSHSLFYYDKEGDEIISINERVTANGNAVACIGYNAQKKYLLVVYTDCNIDFIYDDGKVFNLPALKITSLPGKKEANSISFDSQANRAYVATSFGYLVLNDDKHEVAESRNYGEDVQSVAKCGDNIVLCSASKLYFAPAADQRAAFSDYKVVSGAPAVNSILPLDGGSFVAFNQNSGLTDISLFKWNAGSFARESLFEDGKVLCWQQTPSGYSIAGNLYIYSLARNGEISRLRKGDEELGIPTASLNGKELWTLRDRKGLRSYSIASDGKMTLTRDYMRPNAPATYIATSFAYHPTFGMLCGANGFDLAFSDFNQNTPANISALKGGFWKEYGFPYSGNTVLNVSNYSGLTLDPSNPNYAYRTSTTGGMMRVNLADPKDILVMANPSNRNAGKEGFIEITPDQKSWSAKCRYSVPMFTSDGTMWTLNNNSNPGEWAQIWYWTAADRLASTSQVTYRPMKKFQLPTVFNADNYGVLLPLNVNKNILVMGGLSDGGAVLVYDHNGTPDNTNDDRYVLLTNPYDQDGGSVTFAQINDFFEDPSTGLVWILSQRGPYTFNPATIFDDPNTVNRIKISRNDGTIFADYLLNEISVNHMSVDNEGRKWFSTSNGLVCTSADCRTILAEFTTDNSYLPSDAIFATAYNQENNSIMVATNGGLVEMFPSGSGSSSSVDDSGVRVYPNPVEPDFYGWVRIDNVTDGSLVKITDAKGGIVKELGPVEGGSVQWDVSGFNNTRVATGVYYVMVSPGNGGGNTQISKILVLN